MGGPGGGTENCEQTSNCFCLKDIPEADIIQRLVINAHNFVSIFNKLMYGQRGIVRLNNCVGYLRRRNHGESAHHSIRKFLSYLTHEQSSKTRSSSTAKRVTYLEALQQVATFSFFSYYIKDLFNQFCALCVVSLGPCRVGRKQVTSQNLFSQLCNGSSYQLLPAPDCPQTKLSGRKSFPWSPPRMWSSTPGSKSTKTARGTYLPG